MRIFQPAGWRNFHTWKSRPIRKLYSCLNLYMRKLSIPHCFDIFFKKIMKLSQFAINFMIFSKKIVKTCRFTEFLHGGSCGNQISAWGVMQKSDSFSVVLWRFHEFFYRYRNLSMAIAYIDSYRNIHFSNIPSPKISKTFSPYKL